MEATISATDAALAELARLRERHGPLILVQSGGCCDGSSPSCLHEGDLPLGPGDLLLGEIGGVPFYVDTELYERCDRARFTGYDLDGGYAEWAVADERFCFPLPDGYDDLQVAPLLCAGLIGHRALRRRSTAGACVLRRRGSAAHPDAGGRRPRDSGDGHTDERQVLGNGHARDSFTRPGTEPRRDGGVTATPHGTSASTVASESTDTTGPAVGGDGLVLRGASKRFGSVQALDGCSFSVGRGRMLGFLGPNGAGKTTAMRAIFGLVGLDAGEVLWERRPVEAAERLRFGYMPEERGLYPRMPVGEQLEYFGSLHGLSARAARTAAAEWLERLGLDDRARAKVEELSHGNQQRAQLAAALLHEPELLVLDEPFAGLDPVAVRTLADVLRDEAKRGAAVLFSSHQLELVEDICEQVAIIDRGRIVATGDLDDLRRSARRRRIQLRVEGASPEWLPEVAGVEAVERRNGTLRLMADLEVDPGRVLAAAERAGRVVAFGYGPPTLAELFLELVAP